MTHFNRVETGSKMDQKRHKNWAYYKISYKTFAKKDTEAVPPSAATPAAATAKKLPSGLAVTKVALEAERLAEEEARRKEEEERRRIEEEERRAEEDARLKEEMKQRKKAREKVRFQRHAFTGLFRLIYAVQAKREQAKK